MATGNISSLTLAEKKRLWEQTKYDNYQQIAQDKSLRFNYFMINNDIFKMITPDDQFKFKSIQSKCEKERANVFICSTAAIFIIDQVIFRKFLPNVYINRFRFIVNLAKYLVAPGLMALLYKNYFMDQYQYFFYNMQEKYSFGFQDYMKANKVFQRALAVDRLEQLLQKRDEFDWTGIPELQQQTKKQEQKK